MRIHAQPAVATESHHLRIVSSAKDVSPHGGIVRDCFLLNGRGALCEEQQVTTTFRRKTRGSRWLSTLTLLVPSCTCEGRATSPMTWLASDSIRLFSHLAGKPSCRSRSFGIAAKCGSRWTNVAFSSEAEAEIKTSIADTRVVAPIRSRIASFATVSLTSTILSSRDLLAHFSRTNWSIYPQ